MENMENLEKLNNLTWEKLFRNYKYKYKNYCVNIQNNYVTIREISESSDLKYKTTFIIRYDSIKNIKSRIKAACRM